MKKSIFLFFAAILCSVNAWAFDVTANYYVYFEKPSDWSNVSLLLGHGSWSQGYNMSKISNTNLYYWKTVSWGGASEYYFIDATGWGGEGTSPSNRKGYASHASSKFSTNFSKYHLFTSSKEVKKDASSYSTAVNCTQTIKVQLKDGSNWVDATVVPADLKASTYALTSETAAGAKSASLAKESTTVSATVDAAYSATVSLTCENVLDGYVFDGWYDANGNKITSYTVSDAHTVFARFIQSAEETNEIKVTYMCGTTSVATAIAEIVGVETEKSFTAPTVTGYKFTEWTIGTGITLKAGTASDATISVVTKSASSDYTLIANYEEVIETIYFINTGKWNVVNLHRWNGTATATAWPGEAMPKTGEKIGEYDVYSFTAQQGAFKNVIFTNKNTGNDQTGDLEWTAGKYYINNYNGNSGWYTKAEAEELLVVPAVYETVYFVNNKNWTKVQIHAWKGSVNNGWPGQALTATGEKVEGFDVYSFEAAQGTYTNLIFNNKEGDAGVQSSNFVWTADKYYYMGAAENYAGGTKEEVAALVAPDPLATDVFLAGEMNNWNATANEFKKATAEATTASVTISLTAKTYMFKIIAGDWLGNKGTMKRDNCTGWTFEKLDGGDETNCKIVADIAGDYTFTWDLTNKKLTVTYPELPTYNVTATVNPAETGSVEGAKEYKQGEQATLTATAAEGYEFVNWTKGEEVVSTVNPYKFTVTADVDLVANFAKKVYTVTVAAENGTVEGLAADGKYEHGAEATLTANAAEGYEFVNWTVAGEEVSTEATYSFTVTADVALVANFQEAAAPEINYDEFIMSNLVVTTPAEGLEMLEASDPVNGISVMLGVYEDGTLHEDCLITFQGMELSIVSSEKVTKEYNEDVETDVYTVRVVVAFGGANMGLQLLMYATAPAEPIEVNVTNATATVGDDGWLTLNGTWNELPVMAKVAGYDEEAEEKVYEASYVGEFEYGVWEETESDFGFADQVTVTKKGDVITLEATFTSLNSGNVYNVTITTGAKISTAVENVEVSASPVKMIENGQLIIVKDGVQYNAQGAILK